MRRTNIFRLVPTKEQKQRLLNLAHNCSKMYNEINHKRRQPSSRENSTGTPANNTTSTRSWLAPSPLSKPYKRTTKP
ncbi:MAG: hypothetical protein ACUVXA_10760 [Candidatus Jordarchaeum sp.]|uniref:hypothetical protein n=1 Tax=Candidatus Jordarchaeum sp. TaxID=2823881 RepID=UPI004049DC80